MRDFHTLSIRFLNGKLSILDQTLLPDQETWVDVKDPIQMASLILNLQVRGAPLIGVAAALSLSTYYQGGAGKEEYLQAARQLRDARPTAVNLMHAVDRMLQTQNPIEEAYAILEEDISLCKKMATQGAKLIEDGDRILTHCNTGGLATAGIGTALGVIREAHEQGKKLHVFVDETRPLLQGARLTTWELSKLGIPYTLICDNMAATLMRQKKINRVLVGADRVARNGDFANKIGTYSVAVLARYHHIDFHPVAPWTTVDLNCQNGSEIPIEERPAHEVQGYPRRWAPETASVANPAFDVTPVELVTSWVFDKGCLTQEELKEGLNRFI